MAAELDQVINECKSILAQCQISANQAAAAAASIGAAGLAPLESPLFTGNPRAPTPPFNDSTASIATTAWIGGKLAQPFGIATLDSSGLIPLSQLSFTGLTFVGSWNANTNTPHLTSSSGTVGQFYVVSVAGTTNLNGITTWNVGDQVLFGGGVWQRVPYTAPPISNLPLASLEGINAGTVVANTLGGSASPKAIPIANLMAYFSVVTTGGSGLCPTLPGGTGVFFRGDGAYAAVPGPDLSTFAQLNSPAFSGTATVATQARNLNSTAIASTAFVIAQQGQSTEQSIIKVNGTTSAGTSTYSAKLDHIHPTDTSRLAAANGVASGLTSASTTLTGTTTTANQTVNGTVTLTGGFSQNGTATLTGNSTVNGTMTVTGSGVVNGTMSITGSLLLNGSSVTPGTGPIPAGTQMLFVQASAPTGWTKQTTHNDKALRVVSGTGAGSGGSVAFSTVFAQQNTGNHTLTANELPSTSLASNWTTFTNDPPGGGGSSRTFVVGQISPPSGGGDVAHTHPMDIRVQYVDVLICSKD